MGAVPQTLAYFGARPWHGIGESMTEDEAKNPCLVRRKAGLEWEPVERPCHYSVVMGGPANNVFKNYKVLLRGDTLAPISVVGKDYSVLNNERLFSAIVPLLDKNLVRFEAAGVLFNGLVVWSLVKLERPASEIVKGDDVIKYLLISNNHGKGAIRTGSTDVRAICWNTLNMAHTSAASKLIRIPHRGDVNQKLDDLIECFNAVDAEFEATAEKYRVLARHQINKDDLKKYVKIILDVEDKNEKDLSTRTKNTIEKIIQFHDSGRGSNIPGVRGTLWGAYNAVTEWLTWDRGNKPETRLNALWFGTNVAVNQNALKTALTLAS